MVDLSKLHPTTLKKIQLWLTEVKSAGHNIMITSCVRTPAAQFALYTNGRTLSESLKAALENPRYKSITAQITAMQNAKISDSEIRKKLFSLANLPAGDALRASCVTWTLNSRHLTDKEGYGHAVDFAVLKNNKIEWSEKVDIDNDSISDYKEIGMLAEQQGLVWGGRWKKPDLPHVEFIS